MSAATVAAASRKPTIYEHKLKQQQQQRLLVVFELISIPLWSWVMDNGSLKAAQMNAHTHSLTHSPQIVCVSFKRLYPKYVTATHCSTVVHTYTYTYTYTYTPPLHSTIRAKWITGKAVKGGIRRYSENEVIARYNFGKFHIPVSS
mgnify:CR=1 FL=1